jgi:uncharacterized membrane protein YqhA
MIQTMLRGSRYLVLAAVFGAVAAAFALFSYGFVRTMSIVWQTLSEPQLSSKGGKLLMLAFIEVFDLFLLGTVLLIMGVSLYTLFVDNHVKLPGLLQANSFDDLKINLVAVVIVVMGVTFLGHVVAWDGERDLLRFGMASSLMIAVLTFFLGSQRGRGRRHARRSIGMPWRRPTTIDRRSAAGPPARDFCPHDPSR